MTHMFPNGGASSSSTSVSSQRSETDDDKMIAMVLEEEYAKLDGAMAKRLTNLTSIPHVPRINTYFPTYSDATMDHHRLHDRLNAYGLFEVRVSGDGNCQFRALSDQLYRSPEYHKHVRKEIVKQLKACNSLYEGHVPMKYKHYCKKMKKSGEWGDHVTLQAAADKFAAKICLLTSFRDTCFVEIVPQYQAPQRELWLSFWSEIHYNSLYDARDTWRTDGLLANRWAQDIQGVVGLQEIGQYLQLWHKIEHTTLSAEPDRLTWKWSANGTYSVKSAYLAMEDGLLANRWAQDIQGVVGL
ncbi:hypothetical protein TRIUR3_29562 [Triticum urartu]|uniref:ubiquitinyl hydrolase 1 n=2 Tax=Triticum urartu TaxID=4572 RepID=M7ZTG4_TRIUA|nr:hypothetical protein TRIUR3_29562 [Triticum urartu]